MHFAQSRPMPGPRMQRRVADQPIRMRPHTFRRTGFARRTFPAVPNTNPIAPRAPRPPGPFPLATRSHWETPYRHPVLSPTCAEFGPMGLATVGGPRCRARVKFGRIEVNVTVDDLHGSGFAKLTRCRRPRNRHFCKPAPSFMLNRLFKLDQHQTTVGRELQAGFSPSRPWPTSWP